MMFLSQDVTFPYRSVSLSYFSLVLLYSHFSFNPKRAGLFCLFQVRGGGGGGGGFRIFFVYFLCILLFCEFLMYFFVFATYVFYCFFLWNSLSIEYQ